MAYSGESFAPPLDVATPDVLSNYFSQLPSIEGEFTTDGGTLVFSAAKRGVAWVAVFHVTNMDVSVGGAACRHERLVRGHSETLRWPLANCGLHANQEYVVKIMVSGPSRNPDGDVYQVKVRTFPVTNRFLEFISVLGKPTGDGVTVSLKPQRSGMVQIAVVQRNTSANPQVFSANEIVSDPVLISPFDLLQGNASSHRLFCSSSASLTHNLTSTTSLSSCRLLNRGEIYSAVAYLTAGSSSNGALAAADFVVDQSNSLMAAPNLTGVTGSRFRFSFTASKSGNYWALAVRWEARAGVDLFQLKADQGPDCLAQDISLIGLHTVSVELPCGKLTAGEALALFVYVEGLGGINDGGLYGPVRIFVPFSARFERQPSLVGTPAAAYPSPDGFSISLRSSVQTSNLWLCVANVTNVSEVDIKNQSLYCLGGPSCRIFNVSIDGSQHTFHLSGCSLQFSAVFYVHAYLERPSSWTTEPPDDGSMSVPLNLYIPPSNTFTSRPSVVSATKDEVLVQFATFRSWGRVWFSVVPEHLRQSSNDSDYTVMRSLVHSVCLQHHLVQPYCAWRHPIASQS